MADFIKIARLADIPEHRCLRVEVNGIPIALFKLNGEVFAIHDQCTHAEAPLSEGDVSGDEIICPLHFATFNIRTGRCTGPPADEDVRTFPVRVNDAGDVEVEV